MEQTNDLIPEEKPQGLKVLCILTFIYTTFVGIGSLCGLLFSQSIFQFLSRLTSELAENPNVKEEQLQQLNQFLELGAGKFALICGISFLLIAMSFYGALQMWRLKSRGFIFYAVPNGIMLISNIIRFNIIGIIIDGLFLGLYYWQSRKLKQ